MKDLIRKKVLADIITHQKILKIQWHVKKNSNYFLTIQIFEWTKMSNVGNN